MAVFTPKRLAGPAFLTTSAAVVYTVPAATTGVVKQIIFNNTGSSGTSVTAHVVPNAGSASTGNQIITLLPIGANSQLIWSADIPLAPGETVQLLAANASTVTATVTGIEIA